MERTLKKEEDLAAELIAILSEWINLSRLIEEYKDLWHHTLSGTLFVYVWRSYGWIIYEILSGHYLEALKDMRFLFEGAFLSLHFDYHIDKKLYEVTECFGDIILKREILKLIEDLREIGKRLLSDDQNEVEDAQKRIEEEVREIIEGEFDLTGEEKRKIFQVILQNSRQPELYWSVSRIIREFCREFNIEKKVSKFLLATWSELSDYTHFSSKFLDVIVNRPDLLFINDFDEKLFKKCVNLVFTIFDAICAVLIIHFPKIEGEIREILKWWKENLNRTFILTENIF
jgi:hypothetical protein